MSITDELRAWIESTFEQPIKGLLSEIYQIADRIDAALAYGYIDLRRGRGPEQIPDLKPCPFCGNPTRDPMVFSVNGGYGIYCSFCGCYLGFEFGLFGDFHGMYKREEDAVSAWNERWIDGSNK